MAHSDTTVYAPGEAHISVRTYIEIAVVLFALTALEVGAYEVAHRELGSFSLWVKTYLIELLVVLSAAKFTLVAMFYMHLKTDGRLLKGIFSFSLALAAVVILGLMTLFWYIFHYTA